MPLHPVFDFLPPPKAYAWLVPCYLQSVLLHPKVPAEVSRPARLALMPVSAFLAWNAATDCFHPRDITRGLNAGFAFMTAYGVWKAVEWGFARDRTQYDYVGFGPRAEGKQREEKGSQKGGRAVEPDEITAARRKESWPKALLSQLHLMMSFRMIGYRNFSGKTPPPRSHAAFLRDTAVNYLTAHALFVLSTAFATSTFADRESYLLKVLPFLRDHPVALGKAAQTVATVAVYFLAYNGLELTQQIYSLGYFAVIEGGRKLGLPFAPFQTQEYPSLFDGAYRPTSVKTFWGTHWHQLLRSSFAYFADRAYTCAHSLTHSKPVAKAAAALSVVASTAFIHEFSVRRATSGLSMLGGRSTFLQKNGIYLFFAAMSGLALAEEAYTRTTEKEIGGVGGFLWVGASVGTLIGVLLYPSWFPTYLIKGMPRPQEWEWKRWVYPLIAAMPAPLWTRV